MFAAVADARLLLCIEKHMSTENALPLAKALRTHPKTGGIHPSTARRWHAKGFRLANGTVARLSIEFVGGRLFLSHEAIDRFLEELNEVPDAAPGLRSSAERNKASEKAEAELDRVGVRAG